MKAKHNETISFFALQGVNCEVIPSTYEENLDKSVYSNPIDYVKETAKQKTLEVAKRLASDQVKAIQLKLELNTRFLQ